MGSYWACLSTFTTISESAPPPPHSTPQGQWACGSPYLYRPIDPPWGEVINIIPATFTILLFPGTQLNWVYLGLHIHLELQVNLTLQVNLGLQIHLIFSNTTPVWNWTPDQVKTTTWHKSPIKSNIWFASHISLPTSFTKRLPTSFTERLPTSFTEWWLPTSFHWHACRKSFLEWSF